MTAMKSGPDGKWVPMSLEELRAETMPFDMDELIDKAFTDLNTLKETYYNLRGNMITCLFRAGLPELLDADEEHVLLMLRIFESDTKHLKREITDLVKIMAGVVGIEKGKRR